MLPDVESVWPVIVGRDLDRQSHSIANILDKLVSGSPITLSDLVRENELGVSVDATPKPIVPALCLVVFRKPTRMTADILPLLIHFNTTAWEGRGNSRLCNLQTLRPSHRLGDESRFCRL